MISEFFFIDDNVENVRAQLQGLDEAVDTDYSFEMNGTLFVLTIVSTVLGVIGLSPDEWNGFGVLRLCAGVVFALVVWGIYLVVTGKFAWLSKIKQWNFKKKS